MAGLMNICLLSTSDGRYGGFAAAYRLHQAFRREGLNSKAVVAFKQTDDPDVIQINPLRYFANRMLGKAAGALSVKKTDPNYYFDRHTAVLQSVAGIKRRLPFKPDILLVNYVKDFLTLGQLSRLSRALDAPLVVRLLDMGTFTGGCHYSWDCGGYRTECGRCPALYSNKLNDRANRIFRDKLDAVTGTDLTVVTPTAWLSEKVAEAALFRGKRVEKILLSVDSEIFKPIEKAAARRFLGLPQDGSVIFFGAKSLDEKRKGLKYLLDALAGLAASKTLDLTRIMVVSAGDMRASAEIGKIGLKHRHLATLRDDEALAAAYQSADVFVCPSIQDAGPMMINEAIMCGTPTVAFDMGVARDLVLTGETGYRAELGDSEDLARGIERLLTLPADGKRRMGRQCRELGLKLCAPKVEVQAFERLFESLAVEKSTV